MSVLLIGCDPMMPQATPVAVVITAAPSVTPIPLSSNTPIPSRTALPTSTPDYTPTPTLFPCEIDAGQLVEFSQFPSTVAGGENLRYQVYVPPCYYETERRYPYVLLLHGLSFRETQWSDIGVVEALDSGIRLGALPPMILVMPYYGAIGGTDSYPPDPSYETVILDELLPAIERDFCTISNRDNRAIAGISRGGFGRLKSASAIQRFSASSPDTAPSSPILMSCHLLLIRWKSRKHRPRWRTQVCGFIWITARRIQWLLASRPYRIGCGRGISATPTSLIPAATIATIIGQRTSPSI